VVLHIPFLNWRQSFTDVSLLARTFHKYARALAGALFSQEIFLSRPDPLVRHSLGNFPEKTKSCAIIAAIHELFGLE
jgi:hypothetical protein